MSVELISCSGSLRFLLLQKHPHANFVAQYVVKEIQPVSKNEISEKVEFIGEDPKPGLGLFIPGVRWHQSEGKAFQFGFTGISFDGELLPVPMPMVQCSRAL